MTDFHTHILPGIDDGSRDMEMTEKMLEAELSQGVSHICATPHFYAHRRSVQQFLDRRERALSKVRTLLTARPELPKVTAGAEVYYFSGIGKAEALRDLCLTGTDILLLEMPFGQWHMDVARDVSDIIRKRHLRVVLAHVERYEHMQKDRSAWDEILAMPVTIQMNSGSFIASGLRRHTQKFCLSMLGYYDNCIIGSDCHDLTERPPDLAEARKIIEKKAGRERLDLMDRYTDGLLGV